jgi:lia operon protein LiaG
MKIIIGLVLIISGVSSSAQTVLASAELEAQNVNEVRIDGSFVDVYVKNGDRNYFKGEINGSGEKGDYRFDTEIVGSTLVIKVVRERSSNSWKGYSIRESRIDLTIKDGVSLDIDNSSGDIYVANLRASKSRIEATSGDIKLRSIVSNLKVETSSGDIDIDGLTGDSDIESTSGDQNLTNVRGNIETQSSSGDIDIINFSGSVDITATSGDVEIRGGIGTIRAQTSSGNIVGRNIELTGNANFKATSGDVEIDFENNINDLSFDLTATSGNLNVGSKSSSKRLMIDRGGFKVTGVTSSGDQEYD